MAQVTHSLAGPTEEDDVASTVDEHLAYMKLAIEQARIGRQEGGIPIGAALVVDGEVLGVGRNRRVQLGSAIRHGETDCIENIGRLPAATYHRATLYTTLSPCQMCAGTALLYGIPRVVIGENRTFEASEDWLRANGVDVVVLDLPECVDLMAEFIAAEPQLWNEDIGVENALILTPGTPHRSQGHRHVYCRSPGPRRSSSTPSTPCRSRSASPPRCTSSGSGPAPTSRRSTGCSARSASCSG